MRKESVFALAAFAVTVGLAVVTFEWRDSLMKEEPPVAIEKGGFRTFTIKAEEVAENATEAAETAQILTHTERESESETEATPVEAVTETEVVVTATEAETVQETEAETVEAPSPLYSVNGAVLDEDLQRHLWERLNGYGIGYWMPIALAQMYQECSYDIRQVTNGLDCGLLQYRNLYWDEWCDRAGVERGDIFDAYKQIDVYTAMVAKWISDGCTESIVISNHNSGAWTYDLVPGYVAEVSRWFDTIERVR